MCVQVYMPVMHMCVCERERGMCVQVYMPVMGMCGWVFCNVNQFVYF